METSKKAIRGAYIHLGAHQPLNVVRKCVRYFRAQGPIATIEPSYRGHFTLKRLMKRLIIDSKRAPFHIARHLITNHSLLLRQ